MSKLVPANAVPLTVNTVAAATATAKNLRIILSPRFS
jgi:hypothetical protein